MKLISTVLLASALAFAGAQSAQAANFKVSYVGESSASDPLWSFYVSVMKDTAKEAGVDFNAQFAEGDYAKQVQLIDQAIVSGSKAVVAPLWDENLFVTPVTDAVSKGVQFYGIMGMGPKGKLPADVLAKVGWTEIDLEEWGEKIGEASLKTAPNGATIMWPAEVPSATYITDAIKGFNKVFDANGKKVNIEVIEVTNDSTTAASRIASYLTSHPKTAAVITSGAIAADAAAVAEEQMKLAPGQVPIIGQVTSPNTVKCAMCRCVPATTKTSPCPTAHVWWLNRNRPLPARQ